MPRRNCVHPVVYVSSARPTKHFHTNHGRTKISNVSLASRRALNNLTHFPLVGGIWTTNVLASTILIAFQTYEGVPRFDFQHHAVLTR